jgi:hypothetical protein
MALLYGRAGRLTAQSGGFWPGQEPRKRQHVPRAGPALDLVRRGDRLRGAEGLSVGGRSMREADPEPQDSFRHVVAAGRDAELLPEPPGSRN